MSSLSTKDAVDSVDYPFIEMTRQSSALLGTASAVTYTLHFAVVSLTYKGVSERWSYFGGYPSIEVSIPDIILGALVSLTIGYSSAIIRGLVARLVFASINLLVLIPSLAVGAVTGVSSSYLFLALLSLLYAVCFAGCNQIAARLICRNVAVSESRFRISTIFVVGISLLIVLASYPIRFSDALQFRIYEMRLGMREEDVSRAASYAYGLATRYGIPAITALSICTDRKAPIILSLAITLALFSIGGHKSVLGLFAVAALVAYAMKRGHWRIVTRMPIYLFSAVLAAGIFSYAFDNYVAFDTVIRRTIHLPAILLNEYINEFSANPNFLRLNPLSASEIPFELGYSVFGREEMRANASGLAAAYATQGVPGLMIYSALLAFIAGYIDMIRKSVTSRSLAIIILAISISYLWSMTESALGPVLVTHGLAAFILILSSSLRRAQPITEKVSTNDV